MRCFASSLLRWLTATAYGSRFFRHDEAEFPAAPQTACNLLGRTERGSRAADCAPSDALRPPNNRLTIQDQYELSFIRETLAPFAGRFSTEGRSPRGAFTPDCKSVQENILAAACCTFWRRQKRKATGHGIPQRFATAAAAHAQA
jgi:hypothetical protein